MRSKYAGTLAACAFAAMVVWVGYLLYRVNEEVAISWDQALQIEERRLLEVGVLEQLLQDGQVVDATVELQRIRQRTLARLYGFMTNPHAAASRDAALRVFCTEIPVELPVARNSSEEVGQRRILAMQPLCNRQPG